jgi:hypothetical protein
VAKLVQVARALPLAVGAALLASADGYTPRATSLLDQAREDLGPIQEIAAALAENLPAPKAPVRKSRRRRKKRRPAGAAAAAAGGENANGTAPEAPTQPGSDDVNGAVPVAAVEAVVVAPAESAA